MAEEKEVEVPQSEESSNQPAATAEDYFGYDPEAIKEAVTQVQEEAPEEEKKTVAQIQEEVNRYLKEIEVDENGKFKYPETIPPEIKVAIAATKSARDNQSAYTKTRNELKALEAELKALKDQVAKYETPTAQLTEEESKELEELKYTDPDEWFKRMKALEAQAQEKVKEKLDEVSKQARQQTEQEYRIQRLEEYNKTLETPMTPEMIELNVPPVWGKKLQDGEIDFDQFLDKAAEFIFGPKTVAKPDTPEQGTNLAQVAGSGTPDPDTSSGIDYSQVVL